jgi:hypothetical protein
VACERAKRKFEIEEHTVIIKILKLLGLVVGGALIALGVGRVLFSMTTIPGGGAVNPTVDTETRAGGALLIALGFAYIWAVRRSPIPSALLRFLAVTMALLAVARVISMIATGTPHWIFVASTAVEVTAAALTYWYSIMRDDQPTSTPASVRASAPPSPE